MAIDNFNPTIWSGVLISALQKNLVFGEVANKDYEGVISNVGSSVKLNGLDDITIGDYVKNTNIADPETLTGVEQSLVIDQADYFNFQIDDIDKAQQTPKLMSAAMENAAYRLRDVADRYIASLHTGAAAGNLIGNDTTPLALTADNAYQTIVQARAALSRANAPTDGRWMVVPPEVYSLLLLDKRFVQATSAGDEVMANGRVGTIAGFTIYESNNVVEATGEYKVMFGQRGAITFASQIMQMEAYRPEKRFADAVKGLHVYGAKVVRPELLGVITATVA